MTKTELSDLIDKRSERSDYFGPATRVLHLGDAEKITTQYAKQEAIGFAEWAAQNGWYLNKIRVWSNRNDKSDDLIGVLAATKTTDELYMQYLSQHTQSFMSTDENNFHWAMFETIHGGRMPRVLYKGIACVKNGFQNGKNTIMAAHPGIDLGNGPGRVILVDDEEITYENRKSIKHT